MAKTISATTAARKLSDILDEVEHSGQEFIIERHGRAVGMISSPRPVLARRVTWGEFRLVLERLPKPDPAFARDLREIRRKQGRLPRNPWASSSTRRS